ncbi:MAG: hypothetical protein KDE62_04155 [Calditrichaeota bacterium]|nr:hypothetical protein [Calditrichota bacterium]
MKLKEKLEKMQGKTFMHNGRYYTVLSWQVKDEKLTVATDNGWLEFELSQADKALAEFLPVHANNRQMAIVVMPKNGELQNLKNVILDNIQKVQKDKDYVKQADSINKSISTLINMAKLEISYIKTLKNDV